MIACAETAVRPVRVMLVDDYQVVRDRLKAVLGREKDMTVVAEAAAPMRRSGSPMSAGRTW